MSKTQHAKRTSNAPPALLLPALQRPLTSATPSARWHSFFALKSKPVASLSSALFFAALTCMITTLLFAGFGVGISALALLPAWFGLVTVVAALAGFGYAQYYYKQVLRVAQTLRRRASVIAAGVTEALPVTPRVIQHVRMLLKLSNKASAQSIVVAGFAFIDITDLASRAGRTFTVEEAVLENLHLLAASLTLMLGLLGATFGMQLTMWLNSLPGPALQGGFARRADGLGVLAAWCYQGSLASMVVTFAINGYIASKGPQSTASCRFVYFIVCVR